MANLPTIITAAGLVPRSPAEIQAALLTAVAAIRPGYTATLPGSLIEDISSTDVAAIVECDSAMVETVNSLTPLGANDFLLSMLGQQFGIVLGQASNTSVFVKFTGSPGFVIGKGFIVSDGNYQYVIQNGGVLDTNGDSDQLYALASLSGSWAVPPGTVTQLVTGVPNTVTLTVVNQEAGLPGTGAETATSYRTRVLQAQLAASQGMSRYLRTLLGNVPGVQQRLIAAQQREDGGWMIIVGGGDPYLVANAIWTALFDISSLVGSAMYIVDISSASPAVVETALNHGYAQGDNINIADVNPNGFNGDFTVFAVVSEKEFSLGKRYSANNLLGATWATGTATYQTTTPHGVTVGSTITIISIIPSAYNGTRVVTGVPNPDEIEVAIVSDPGAYVGGGQLSAGIALFDSSALTYIDGGIITPNPRNIRVSINDYPDTYVIPYVNPPQQVVTMDVEWNTISPNFVSQTAVAQLTVPALVEYINSIVVGQPINLDTMAEVFRAAAAPVITPELITRLVFAVSINGTGYSVISGTVIIEGDPESYFYATSPGISVTQG